MIARFWPERSRQQRSITVEPWPQIGSRARKRRGSICDWPRLHIITATLLCLAVEAGGGAAAWSALVALFQSLGDGARLGVALYAWSQHEVDEARVDLLRQAARHVGPSLLLAIDEALLSLGADDESVRERLLLRRRQSDDRPGTLSLLIRDMAQSTGARRWASAKLAAETARLLGDAATEAEAVLVSLSAPPSASDEEALRATGLLAAETSCLRRCARSCASGDRCGRSCDDSISGWPY